MAKLVVAGRLNWQYGSDKIKIDLTSIKKGGEKK